MSRRAVIVALAASAALSACASQQQVVAGREDLLAAAGFRLLPANTPGRQAQLAALPPNRFVTQAHGDRVAYLYADPLVCGCLYVGGQAAYDRFRQEQFQQHLATQAEVTAQLNENAGWDWGPWGPGPFW